MPFIPLEGGMGLVAVKYFVVVELQLADGLGFGIFVTGRDVAVTGTYVDSVDSETVRLKIGGQGFPLCRTAEGAGLGRLIVKLRYSKI